MKLIFLKVFLTKTKIMKQLFFLILTLISFEFTSTATEMWNQKSKIPATGRHRGTAIAIGDRGYVGLGHMNGTGTNIVYKDWWEFDPATNSWTQKADYPLNNYATVSFAIGTDAYVGGGIFLGGEFYKYSRALNTWTAIANCPGNPADETAFTLNDKGYVLDNGNFYEYDPTINLWATKANCPVTNWSLTSFVIQNKGYVKGGSALYEYKPSADQWALRASYPGLANSGSAAFSINNKGYIICGYGFGLSDVQSEMWEYDPALNSWTQKEDFIGTSRRFCSGFNINNKGYLAIGTNGTNMNDFWEYNPALEGLTINESITFEINIYPNPSTDFVIFEPLNNNESKTLTIYNSVGQLILTKIIKTNKIQISKNNLSNGTYHYQLKNELQVLKTGTFIFK